MFRFLMDIPQAERKIRQGKDKFVTKFVYSYESKFFFKSLKFLVMK